MVAPDSTATAGQAQVKLIVWDLDDTLWRGTLAEGPVRLIEGRSELIEHLLDRGIVVSICSKNDPAAARAELESFGLWERFVFPRIGWDAKGPRIADVITSAGLRPVNTLFIDDLALNREEAAYFAPGLQTLDPASPDFDRRISEILASGKDDRGRSRLAEYRILEAKVAAAATFADNREFLRSCEIRVRLTRPGPTDAGRIHELIARTNQLNYVKRRVTLSEIEELLGDAGTNAVAVRVVDRFGNYGLVGFAAVRDGAVEHLAFSCRILGMGVERAVYQRLGSPSITIAEPVSASLDGPPVDWLEIEEVNAPVVDDPPRAARAGPTILVAGGCDVESAVGFLTDAGRVDTYMNRSPVDRPRLIVHRDSIDYLLADRLSVADRARVLDEAPFLDPSVFSWPDWSMYDHIVYSPLIDYVQAKYTSAGVPDFYCSFGDQLTPDLTPEFIARFCDRSGVDPDAMARFAAGWRPAPKPDATWQDQLRVLFGRMSRAQTITVLLGATKTFEGLDEARLDTHRRANAIVREVAIEFPNAAVLDIDPFVRGADDFRGSIRHYSRRVYRDIAAALSERVGSIDVAPLATDAGRPRATTGWSPRRIVRGIRRRATALVKQRPGSGRD